LEDGDEDDDKILINPTTYSEIVFYLTSIIYLEWVQPYLPEHLTYLTYVTDSLTNKERFYINCVIKNE